MPPSPSATPRRGWWSRPIVAYPAVDPTCKEEAALYAPCCGTLITVFTVLLILNFLDNAHSHAKFAIQSINISPSATWHVDFLVKNPSSRYSIDYDIDDVSVRLGSLNAAVLNITRIRDSRDLTAFALAFVAAEEDGRNDVVWEQVLDVKLRGSHKLYVSYVDVGHFDISCRNLTRSHHKFDKIICHSSFTTSHNYVIMMF